MVSVFGAWSARPDRGGSRGLAGMRRQGRGRLRRGQRTWSRGVLAAAAWRTSPGAAVPARSAAGRGPARSSSAESRSLGAAIGVVELSYALTTLAELRRELGDRRGGARARAARRASCFRALRNRARSCRDWSHRRKARSGLVCRSLRRGLRRYRRADARASRRCCAYFPRGLSAREIGGELGISRDTVKTHTKSIYRKLGVSSRRDAVARARELELL